MNQLEILTPSNTLDFNDFPFNSIIECFKPDNYESNILIFAQYYFSKLPHLKDEIFGCLNPLLFSIFHGNSKLLQTIVQDYGYPKEFSLCMTPIEYSKLRSQDSCLETICIHLIKSEKTPEIKFNLKEFKILLKSKSEYSHEILSGVLTVHPEMRFPALAKIKRNINIEAKKELMKFLLKMQKGGVKCLENDFSVEYTDQKKNLKRNKKIKTKLKNDMKSEVDILTVPFVYDYSLGSEDSVQFLYHYSESNSQEFVSSEWRHLISHKWKAMKIINIINALLFYGLLSFATLAIVFDEQKVEYSLSLISMVSVFIFLEVLQVLAYLFFNFKAYVLDIWNYVDWIFFTITIIYPNTLQTDDRRDGGINKLMGTAIILIMYYRGFSYLRIFDFFTSLVGMINTIFSNNNFILT